MNKFESLESRRMSSAELEKSRDLYEKNVKLEKSFINDIIGAFVDKSIKAGIENARAALTVEDVERADAERINELKEKAESGKISEAEKKELRLREAGDMFLVTYLVKDVQPKFPTVENSRVYKEAFYPQDTIMGVLGSKRLKITRHTFPVFTERQLEEESREPRAFHMEEWKGPVRYEYQAEVDKKETPEKDAEHLFGEYVYFAEQRTKELEELKRQKEIEVLGHEVK